MNIDGSESTNRKMSIDEQRLFQSTYKEMSRQIYWYVLKKVNKEEIAEDIAAETFMKLVENVNILNERPQSGVKAWLYTVARNKVIDYYRKYSDNNKVDIDEEVMEIIAKEEGHYLEDAIKNEDNAILLNAMNNLSGNEKEILSLRFNDEMAFNEIAQCIGKSEGSVKMTLYRSLEKLKEIIENSEALNRNENVNVE